MNELLHAFMWAFSLLLVIAAFLVATQQIDRWITLDKEKDECDD